MIKELLQPLYLEHLTEEVVPDYLAETGYKKKRPRVRNPETWRKLAEQYPGATLKDLPGNVWLWSDHHFGHKNILGFSDRPFTDLIHMRENLIGEHNVRIWHDDTCIFVGDFAFLPDNEANEILHRLNGRKILIIGNHDIQKKKLKKLHFDEVYMCAHMEVDNMDFMFTHYPMLNVPDWCFNIHGHEHIAGLFTDTPQHFNVNCELLDYRPIKMDQIAEQARMRQLQM